MKILVGIMYCIENEFEQCKEAIRRQTYTNWELFTIENLPNKEAHDTLYQTFMNRAAEFDLFIKIDADMVLCRDTFFEEVVKEMQLAPSYDHFQIGVWDHFTDRLIYALHVYRHTVRWIKNEEQYFVDMTNEPTHKKIYMDLAGPLAPAADHCPNPSPFQAFHFGVHKAVKVMQVQQEIDQRMGFSHIYKLRNLLDSFFIAENPLKKMALSGAAWAFAERKDFKAVDFGAKETHEAFRQQVKAKDGEVNTQISKYLFTEASSRIWPFLIFQYSSNQKGRLFGPFVSAWLQYLKKKVL